ncbi:LRR receptor-like serine/threonine-protein kinase RGI1 [Lycium barbarum]|uniref:LRR receptor-like serine/threonine-protein kinase RGI1 n=1 Tax=Lycium barbarum TaxID=112863 RepID=UPI00293F6C8B|nr:LRR receptor-like serine/threonine-protein kinase RGI1 [Lycium barbarum]
MKKMLLCLLPLVLIILSNVEQVQGISAVDLSALREIKNSLTDISSSSPNPFFTTWDFTTSDPCSTFAGITCSSSIPKRVTTLNLGTGLSDSPGLAGTLSPAISNISELTQLILFTGIVTGPIPSQLGTLKKLSVISLTNNRLTGSIPASIFSLPNLHTLDLSHNQLTGTIPGSISTLSDLKVVILGSNKLSGVIPQLPAELLHLDLSNNEFSGMLPKRMPLTLRYLSVLGNSLWGPLSTLESLSELVYLDLSMNRFSGPIPTSLFRATLSSMFLQRNNFTGGVPQLPPTSSLYGPGSTVDLSHNYLTGELTNTLTGVETLFLNNNMFTGSVPRDYVESVYSGNTKTLYLQHNYIAEFPVVEGLALPDSVALCLSYNCMVPPVPVLEFMACPASAGDIISRPVNQCSAFNTSMA